MIDMKRKVFFDAFFNILLQISIIASGLILPRFIIGNYGSTVNGMVVSINQFLSYITLLESGIGGVIKSQLYKPLLQKDTDKVSGIVNAANSFFRKIGLIFIIYLLCIAGTFKFISTTDFDWVYVFTLVLILGVSTLVQYFVGITYQTVLQADQHYSFTSIVQIITLWLNVGLSMIVIFFGGSIHLLKLITALLFAARPICYYIYAKTKYSLRKDIPQNKEALSQRWDGFGHHLAYFIHSNTDIVLLTIFASLNDVSVYSVYLMIVTGVRSLISAVSSAFEPYFGKIIASNDKERLASFFNSFEFFYFLFSTILFGATLVLIIPFVKLYSSGVTDANYIQVAFSILIVSAEFVYCIRTPYSMVIFASGHFKQTKIGAFVEAGINILISIALVIPFGLIGVAIGTLTAMLFRTIEYVFYLSKQILSRNPLRFLIRFIVSCISIVTLYIVSIFVPFSPDNYFQWIIMGVIVTLSSALISLIISFIIDFNNSRFCFSYLIKSLRKKQS